MTSMAIRKKGIPEFLMTPFPNNTKITTAIISEGLEPNTIGITFIHKNICVHSQGKYSMPNDWVKQKSGSDNGHSDKADPLLGNPRSNMGFTSTYQKGQKISFTCKISLYLPFQCYTLICEQLHFNLRSCSNFVKLVKLQKKKTKKTNKTKHGKC